MVVVVKRRQELIGGIPAWLHDASQLANMKAFIDKNSVKPAQTTAGKIITECDGLRLPHLHYDDKIYILSKAQWADFSGGILKEFGKTLAATKTISFDHMQELTDTLSAI
jgi:hypothetical protein